MPQLSKSKSKAPGTTRCCKNTALVIFTHLQSAFFWLLLHLLPHHPIGLQLKHHGQFSMIILDEQFCLVSIINKNRDLGITFQTNNLKHQESLESSLPKHHKTVHFSFLKHSIITDQLMSSYLRGTMRIGVVYKILSLALISNWRACLHGGRATPVR